MTSSIGRRQFVAGAVAAATAARMSPVLAGTSRTLAEYMQYDAMGLAALVRSGDASPAELLEVAISRAEQVDPSLNAITVEHFELARKAVRSKLPEGPFTGVPYLLKDLGVAMKGTVTTEGSRFYRDAVHDYDSEIVRRYRRAGLVIFGKTHSPEFGSSPSSESALHGRTHNPWDITRSAGGSSGGAGAAVAGGIVPMAHATDGGGSIRIPASSCGLVGLKPTRGRNPSGPHVYEGWDGLSAGHVVSRSVRDTALALDATQGPDIGDAYATAPRQRPYIEECEREPGQLRIALMTSPMLPMPAALECVKAAEAAAKLCESLGHRVEEARPEFDALSVWQNFGVAVNANLAASVGQREKLLGRMVGPKDLEPINLINVAAGRKVTGAEHVLARQSLHHASRALGAFHQKYDLILSPTMAQLPPKLGVLALDTPMQEFMINASLSSAFTALYNITGAPAISLPLHRTEENLPVGVMFAAPFGDEATLIRLAAQLERAQPWPELA